MKSQTAVQKLLHRKLAELQAKNPAYSLRAFARRLGVGPSTVSMVLAGERAVSAKLARKLCDALMLDPQARAEVLSHFPDRNRFRRQREANAQGVAAGEVITPEYLQLSADQFRLMSEWHYYGILSLIKIEGFRDEPAWIAQRLGISLRDAETAMTRLKRMGILVEQPDGSLQRSAPAYRSTDDLADVSLRKSHFQNLELARASLERDDVTERDFTHMTFPMDPELLPEIKQRVRRFQDELDVFIEQHARRPSEVFRFCTQLIPLTRSPKPLTEKKEK